MTRRLLLAAALACAPALHAQVPVLQPERLVEGVDTLYTVRTQNGVTDTVHTAVQTMRRVAADGTDLWEVEYAWRNGNGEGRDTTVLEARTLLPRAQHRASGEQRTDVEYRGAEVRQVTRDSSGALREARHTFEQPVFAGSLMEVVYRALPLEDAYITRVPFYVMGSESHPVWWIDVIVFGPETVETSDGPVAAWRIKTELEGQMMDVYWIARDTRMLLRVDHPDGTYTLVC